MTDVALAGLVKEGVSSVGCMARGLLPRTVLALDVVAAQMASLHASFVTLDPGHLGDLGQSTSLCGCSTAHPGGDGRGSGRFSPSAAREKQTTKIKKVAGFLFLLFIMKQVKAEFGICKYFSPHAARQADEALLSHHRQVTVGDHGQNVRGDVHRHAGVLYKEVLHGTGLCCGSLCSETGGRGDKPTLIHAASL